MNEKKSFAQRIDMFFNGKGFYIVLFICAAVIGISAWSLLSGNDSGDVDDIPVMNGGVGSEDGLSAFVGTNPGGSVDAGVVFDDPNDTAETLKPETSPTPPPASPEPPAPEATAPPEAPAEKPQEKLTFVWPAAGNISMAYSVDYPVYNKTMSDWRTHGGVDIEAEIGTRVLAAASGTVSEITDDEMYGTTVIIDHGAGLQSIYSNLAATPAVSVGDAVTTASVIGSVGTTALAETAEPSHLHFAMTENGAPVDPASYLPAK